MGTEYTDDVLPWSKMVGGIDLRDVILAHRPIMEHMGQIGILDPGKESFGFALANPYVTDYQTCWDDPKQLIWIVGGWGPEVERYVANAVRNIRAAARTGRNTLGLSANERDLFRDEVESGKDGNFPWGDFPWGTALFMQMYDLNLLGAVSTYTQERDGVAAAPIMADIVATLFRHDNPGSDDD